MSQTASSAPKAFADLRAFITMLEQRGELIRIDRAVDPNLEITEISTRLLAEGGPAVLFTNPVGGRMPVLANLFGSQERVGLAVGQSLEGLSELGELLAWLKQPEPPTGGIGSLWEIARNLSRVRHMPTRRLRRAPWMAQSFDGDAVDLGMLPLMTCWPGDVGPLITWPLVITQGPDGGPVNIGIYRMQPIGRNRLIMRWLKHRGGAQHARAFHKPIPVAVAIGADPGTILAAVTPVPDTLSEYAFGGLMREKRIPIVKSALSGLPIPASAEIVLEGTVDLNDVADEGPYGDHTGYYNEVERFPVFTVQRMSLRQDPIYLSTFTGRPPDEPSVLALALNRVFVPLLRKQFPEIVAFHLPAEACSYRAAVIALKKGYPGHAFRAMTGVWGFLRQFLYTKTLFVVDAGVDVTDWDAVMDCVARHVHPGRDLHVIGNTPIDYLDFASPQSSLGGKLGVDATTKIGAEADIGAPFLPPPDAAARWSDALMGIDGAQSVACRPELGLAALAIEKRAAGQSRRAIEQAWAALPPEMGPKQLWIVDGDIDPHNWDDLIWVLATRFDASRDLAIEPSGLRFAWDVTNKLPGETEREWGTPIVMRDDVIQRVDAMWPELGLPGAGKSIWR
ncbi:UbiD family decarboxylase [Magnetofaba australis]|uniref:Putative 3-octaprenyl-4-hydroxybenzoate carboxy-lyase n=1 Tax=Magnetofaba australis IT-1 TaxID=1434232 RepID=A0A1Y2K023_9PROT|nr:UbiD family decarboxylase [Magnetofaba australis]OSM01380.1 putative 3-octaprenyl-4-hydroxybenzoate carboxy-lyase [Magnetofaba australis IT-1]